MTCKKTNLELAAIFKAVARGEGEVVWNRQIIVGNRRFSLPFMGTTRLANEFEQNSLIANDPNAWVVQSSNEDEWRLYLRVGERYGEGWAHYFVPPVEVAINSPHDFMLISQLPQDQWWQAEFVCPFCNHFCSANAHCPHLLIVHHSIKEPYRGTTLASLLAEMRDRAFNCNMLNAGVEGLRIKVPRMFVDAEWFRFAYWYIRSPVVVAQVEQTLLEGKRATRYDN
jgi:hypothetical protein